MNNDRSTATYDPDDMIKEYLRVIMEIPSLEPDEEKELVFMIKEGDEASRNKLAEANLGLVFDLAKKHENDNAPILDLIQEGNTELFRSIDDYDPESGERFSKFAKDKIDKALSERFG